MGPKMPPRSEVPRVDSIRRHHDRARRTPNAHVGACSCKRCRQHKIKCTGSRPCAHCQKRNTSCIFDEKSQKIFVTRGRLYDLERQAARAAGNDNVPLHEPGRTAIEEGDSLEVLEENGLAFPSPTSHLGIDPQSDSEHDDCGTVGVQEDYHFTNLLVSGNSAYYSPVSASQSYWLGTSSNWSFGRRVLTLAHSKVFGDVPLPHDILHYDGSTYELGWDGRRTESNLLEQPALPTVDYARFLIGAVKFHCGQLFHLFDEDDFMHHFAEFHHDINGQVDYPDMWFVHYLLVLSLGKALLGQTEKKRPPGADLFVYAMKILPDMMFLWTKPMESVEVLCCGAIYLQCLDMRMVAYNLIGQAMRIAITNGWHTDIPCHHHSEAVLERCRKIWWTVYILDCHMSALQGAPTTLAECDISAQLPHFGHSVRRSLALKMHVKLAKIMASIQQTVYSRRDCAGNHFLKSMTTALKSMASINDERASSFPLELNNPSRGISRVSAHLHLFHHQGIILATKPLLFYFFRRRLEASATIHIPSSGGVRALVRVSVGSAQQIIKILTALRTQNLLETFIPFDLESVWSAALVLLISRIVDPSICSGHDFSSLQIAHAILDDMAARGNLIAVCRKAELEHLDTTLKQLDVVALQVSAPDSAVERSGSDHIAWDIMTHPGSDNSQNDIMPLQEWNIEDVLSGQQLEAVADSLNMIGLDWFTDEQHIDELYST